MIQRPPSASLTPDPARRDLLPLLPALRAWAAGPDFREDVRFFLFAYVAALCVFLTWLA